MSASSVASDQGNVLFATPGALSHEEQDQLFTLVHAHWMKALSAPSLRMPLITTHLLNVCLQRLDIESQQVGQLWVIGDHAPDEVIYNGLITGVQIPGFPVISHLGERGWEAAQSWHLAKLEKNQEDSPPESYWLNIEQDRVDLMLEDNLRLVDSLRIQKVVSAVVAIVQQHWLRAATSKPDPATLHPAPRL